MTEATPDYIEPLLGWRVWRVRYSREQVRLLSLSGDVVWPPYEPLVARSGPFGNEQGSPVALQSHYGVYAFAQPLSLLRQLPLRDDLVIGRVALWGEVAIHQRGYRAQFAYPHDLIWAPTREIGMSLGAIYGVPYSDSAKARRVFGFVHALRSLSAATGLPITAPKEVRGATIETLLILVLMAAAPLLFHWCSTLRR